MSQRAEVLHMLRGAPGHKVTSEQLLAAGIPRYSAHIFEPRAEGHRISMTPQKGRKTVVFRLEFDAERTVSNSPTLREREGTLTRAREERKSPKVAGNTRSSRVVADGSLSVEPGVEGGDGHQASRRVGTAVPFLSAGHKPLNPYEWDLLGEAA